MHRHVVLVLKSLVQVWDIPESSKALVQRVLLEAQASPSVLEILVYPQAVRFCP